MRHIRLLSCVVALTACARPAATTGKPVATTNPCAIAGTCLVDVQIPDDVASYLQRVGVSFRAYDGCPRMLGFRDNSATGTAPLLQEGGLSVRINSTMRGAPSLTQTSNSTIVLPRMTGRVATIGIFFRADPGKYVVVDFSRNPEQTVRFGYIYSAGAITDDNFVDTQNRSAERRICG